MQFVSIKDVLARDPGVVVTQDGTGPAAGGLWNTSIAVGDLLVLSSPSRYCLGGVTLQKRNGDAGLYGKKEHIALPGGAIAWWPGGGYLSYEIQWATVLYQPVDKQLRPLPGAAYPILSHAGIPGFPGRSGQNIAAGDVTGDGKPDVLLTLKDWGGDGYFPDGLRWGSPGYRPYEQRENAYPGHDPRRDERLPFWGSKALVAFQQSTRYDENDGLGRLACKNLFGGYAGDDVLCTLLPRDGPFEFSLSRTYRGKSPASWYAVFAGDGSEPIPSIEGEEGAGGAFEFAGVCKLECGDTLTTFADGGACILPGGDLVTVDFVGVIQYFRRVGPGLVFKELPVSVEGGRIPAIHGCIGTVSTEHDMAGHPTGRIVLSGENGITQAVGFKQNPGGLWIECPDDHVLMASGDQFKEDILVVPSFVDGHVVVLGSGAGRYSKARMANQAGSLVGNRMVPYSPIRVQAGPVGSVQGTTEERWGYTCPCVFDVNGDGGRLVISGDISEYLWLIAPDGKRTVLKDRNGKPVRTAWRVRPAVFSIESGTYLVTLDQANRGVVFQLDGTTLEEIGCISNPDGSIFGEGKHGGARGRLKFEATRGEGALPDLLVGTTVGTSMGKFTAPLALVGRLRSRGTPDRWRIDRVEVMGVDAGDGFAAVTFGHHCCAPATIPDGWDGRSPKRGTTIVVGAEDGRLYQFKNPRFSEA